MVKFRQQRLFRFDRVGYGVHGITMQAKGYEDNKTEFSVGIIGMLVHIVLRPDTDVK
jgi:hypothetical protein